nr:hypothetical protein [uncultured Flavobacterium sp.]
MKIKFLYFLFLILISCGNQPYELHFDKYEDFSKIKSPRIKGYFPVIINSDSYDLKSDSYLNNCDFIKFNYFDDKNYDSIFLTNPKVKIEVFQQKIKDKEMFRPDWFPKYNEINSSDFEIILADGFDIARKKSTKEIYGFCNPYRFPIR